MCGYGFEVVEPYTLEYLRDMQIEELRGPAQDSTEEAILTYHADFVKIFRGEETAGYACIGTHGYHKDIVLEYYLASKFRSDSCKIIKHLAEQRKCKQWLVNTQDFFAFPVMLDLRVAYDIDAYKFSVDNVIKPD